MGDGSGRFGLESCWGSAVKEPCSTEFLADEVATSTESTPGSLHHLSLGRQKATLGSFLGDGSGRFGLESCWGSAVSQPCSTELLVDEVAASMELLSKPVPCPAGVSLFWMHRPLQAVASSFFRASESS